MLSLRTRRLFFYFLVIIFIFAGTGLIFYSRGWRPSFNDNCGISQIQNCWPNFQKTGAIFLKLKTADVTIKLNGKQIKYQTNLFQNNASVKNLLPHTYSLEITKPDYQTWQKNLKVESGLLNRIQQIILIPKNPGKEFVSLTKEADNFWISQEKIVFRNNGILYYLQGNSSIKLKGNDFIAWNNNADKLIVEDNKSLFYYLYDINNISKSLNINTLLNNLGYGKTIKKIAFHPFNNNKLLVETQNNLISIDIKRSTSEIIVAKNPIFWNIKNPNLYYIKKTTVKGETSYNLVMLNLTTKIEVSSIALPFKTGSIKKLEIPNDSSKIAILNSLDDLYIFDIAKNKIEKIGHNIETFAFSPDNKKLAFLDKNNLSSNQIIKIYFFEEMTIMDSVKKQGEIIEVPLSCSCQIKKIEWHKESLHFLIEYNDRLTFVEMDTRLPINENLLAKSSPSYYYNSGTDTIYFLKNNAIWNFKFKY